MPFPDEFMQSKVEREALYADLGWRFVANRWDYQVYVCEDPAAAELETDPVAASWAWDRLLRKQRRHMLLAWIFLLTAVIWIARSILTAEYPVRFLMRSAVATGSLVLMTVWMAYWTVSVSEESSGPTARWLPDFPGRIPGIGKNAAVRRF